MQFFPFSYFFFLINKSMPYRHPGMMTAVIVHLFFSVMVARLKRLLYACLMPVMHG